MAVFRAMTDTPQPIPRAVVHYSKHDPLHHVGGVETFGRNLQFIFERVEYMTPQNRDFARVERERLPIICDNHWVLDVPKGVPAIGFQHGVAAVKRRVTKRLDDYRVAWRQGRAARRKNTIWVSNSEWVSRRFRELHGNGGHVIYYQVDLERFDGRLDNQGSRLILHDGRSENKGKKLMEAIAPAFPDWQFEPLKCHPSEVPDRMRRARAFMHLSKYEGNSVVCNEAMAHNLPCFFTRVGLFNDEDRPTEVCLIEPEVAYADPAALISKTAEFLRSLETVTYQPRAWVEAHASRAVCIQGWRRVIEAFDALQR